jgi:glycosyltransferase involved in cell wall biosynthesis
MPSHIVLTSHYGDPQHLHHCIKSVILSFNFAGIDDYLHVVFVDGLEGKNLGFNPEHYNYRNLTLHISKINVGKSSAFNFMLSSIDCQYIYFLDSDDLFFPQKISHQSQYLYSNDVVLGTNYFSYIRSFESIFSPSSYPTDDLHIRSAFVFFPYLLFSSFACRFSTLSNFSLSPFDESLTAGIDYHFYSTLLPSVSVSNLPTPLVFYRVNPDGMTKTLTTRIVQLNTHITCASSFLAHLNPSLDFPVNSAFLIYLLFSSTQIPHHIVSALHPSLDHTDTIAQSKYFLDRNRSTFLSDLTTASVFNNMNSNLLSWVS